ncbi:CHRD domain-containing protein [Isosphaeraceae bacterium EP7]
MIRSFGPSAIAMALICLGFSSSSRAEFLTYVAVLDGPSEAPPVDSPGTGFATLQFDSVAHTLHLSVTFSGLIGETTASHIHGPTAVPGAGTAGVATQVPTFVDFPLGVTSGSYDHTFDTSLDSFYNPAFLNNNGGTALLAEAALASSLAAGTAYLNIHSTFARGGEIRGFFTLVPEPSSVVMMGLGIAGLMGYAGRGLRRASVVRQSS